jgi:transcriptional regulator with XRE-family HTH domain
VSNLDGKELRNKRQAAKKTQKALASDIGVSVRTVSRWEKSSAPLVVQYYFDQIGA